MPFSSRLFKSLKTIGIISILIHCMNAEAGSNEAKLPYPVSTSTLEFVGLVAGISRIAWLDNDRVLVPAVEVEKHKDSSGKEIYTASPFGLYIWDVKKNTTTRYATLGPIDSYLFQYDHGNIAYSLEKHEYGVVDAMIGKMGEEKPMTIDRGHGGILPELEPSMGPGLRFLHDPENHSLVTAIYALMPDDGYIQGVKGKPGNVYWPDETNENDPVYLSHGEGSKPIALPIFAKELSGANFAYSDYLKKYTLIPSMAKNKRLADPNWNLRGTNDPYPYYLISSNGQVEAGEIPPGYWSPAEVFPSSQGIFWVSNNLDKHGIAWATLHKDDIYQDAGGFLLKDDKVIKLFDRRVRGASVSPDGCTIAYAAEQPDHIPNYLKAINLCAVQERK